MHLLRLGLLAAIVISANVTSPAQSLDDALNGLDEPSANPVDANTVRCDSVRYFLRHPTYWKPREFRSRYESTTWTGRARLAYLAARADPRTAPSEFFRVRSLDPELGSEERYLCYGVYLRFTGYWRSNFPPSLLHFGLPDEVRRRLDQLLDAKVDFARGPDDRRARAGEVGRWIGALGRREARAGYERTSQVFYVRKIMLREQCTEPELLDEIEGAVLAGTIRWDVGLLALEYSTSPARALRFARKHWRTAATSDGLLGLRIVLRKRGQRVDAEMLTKTAPTLADPLLRKKITAIAGEIHRRLRREVREKKRAEIVKKMQRGGRAK